ncbi:hypothetical protein PoB_003446500 [Plakobranchus ocellatus]|uniref:C1q domain-containing protein n=1 Tax=Plakobranchus ocellatus TaxID=259542 RepID=A0AAV4AIG2_9GAST|nr:hypothetical protein PoB_003446500 [Plakobranchus ocellatus]
MCDYVFPVSLWRVHHKSAHIVFDLLGLSVVGRFERTIKPIPREFEIDREESGNLVPLATITPNGVKLNTANPGNRLSAEGNLTNPGVGAHLNLTIANPTEQDSGHYVCIASITDKTATLVKLSYDLNVTYQDLSKEHLKTAIINLGQKVDLLEADNSNLLSTISQLQQQTTELAGNLTSVQIENGNLKTGLSSLERRLQTVEKELAQERNENNVTDSDVLKMIDDLTDKISNISSLSANNNNQMAMPNCSCCDTYGNLTNDVATLQASHSNLMSSLQESIANYTHMAADLVIVDSNVESAVLRLSVLENMATGQYAEMAQLQSKVSSLEKEPQAFSARRASYLASYPNQTNVGDVGDLTFHSVTLDNHNAFDMSTGELTIKTSGNFLISLTLSLNMVLSAAVEGGVKVNDHFVGFLSTSSHGILNSGSTTVAAKLTTGDKVMAKISKVIAQPVTINADESIFSVVYLG